MLLYIYIYIFVFGICCLSTTRTADILETHHLCSGLTVFSQTIIKNALVGLIVGTH